MVGTRNARLFRRTLAATIVAVSGLVIAAPMAAADPCPPLDLGCVVDDTTTTVGGATDDTTTTVGGAVDDATTAVGGVVDDTTTAVGGVTDEPTTSVGGAVDDTTTTVGGVVEDPTTTVGGAGQGTGPGDTGTVPEEVPGSGGTTPGGGTQVGQPSSGSRQLLAGVGGRPASGSVLSAAAGEATAIVSHPFPSFLDAGGDGALLSGARLVQTLAFPLVLILLVIGFVFLQNRIDRKDPKLALAPVHADHLTFS